jgi:hypothetical protein
MNFQAQIRERKHQLAVMELSTSREAASYTATQELLTSLWKQRVHYRAHKSRALVPILNRSIPSSTHLRLVLSSGMFPSGFLNNNLHAFLFYPIRATWPTHLILIYLIILILLAYDYPSVKLQTHFSAIPLYSSLQGFAIGLFRPHNSFHLINHFTYRIFCRYSSPSIIRIIKWRMMRWVGHVTRMGEKRNSYRLLVGKPEGKRPLGRPRRRWVDNIRMDLGGVGWGDVDWNGLVKDRNRWRALVSWVLNHRVPWNAGKLSSGVTSSSISSSVQLHRVS